MGAGGAVVTSGAPITDEDKYREALREVGLRHGFYAKAVKAGRMTRDVADRRIAVMQAIANDYGAKVQPHLTLE